MYHSWKKRWFGRSKQDPRVAITRTESQELVMIVGCCYGSSQRCVKHEATMLQDINLAWPLRECVVQKSEVAVTTAYQQLLFIS